MASQQDVQELLRMLTTGRGKLPMLSAMGRIKALQAAGLRSIADIATASLQTVKDALGDEKAAKSLHTAAKNTVKDPSKSKKRGPSDDAAGASDPKRRKSAYELGGEPETPEALEASLALPEASSDDVDEISKTVLYTNRAPLLLTFVLVLLKFTMPEQPLSSRLSLAQALVSVNSRSKAVSLGIEKGSAEQDGWGHGQPKVKIMGREVYVLKRGDFNVPAQQGGDHSQLRSEEGEEPSGTPDSQTQQSESPIKPVATEKGWTTSQSITSKQSKFVARSIPVHSSTEARKLRDQLFSTIKELQDASHNVVAWRAQGEDVCDDDGESGAGMHVLKLLRDSNIDGIMLVVTRWYGGVFLGTDRWRIISEVCRDALSQRLRVSTFSGEALWGLDLESAKSAGSSVTGMPIHKSENARAYIMKAFASPPEEDSKKKKTGPAVAKEKEKNLSLLIAALNILFESWAEHLSRDELDRRAWSWYAQLRPEVSDGVQGWGAKGAVKLSAVLDLRCQQ